MKKENPPILWIIAVKKRKKDHPYFINRVNVPSPGQIMFNTSLVNEAHPKFEAKYIKSDPHPTIISKGIILNLIELIIVFLFTPDKINEINVPVIPMKIKVILTGKIVIISLVSLTRYVPIHKDIGQNIIIIPIIIPKIDKTIPFIL